MATLTTYSQANVKTTKDFTKACTAVFGSIKQRNEQVQQLLILAVQEAAKLSSNGQASNNLTWLSNILVIAEDTQGINLTKIVKYIKEVLCCNTVAWNKKDNKLTKTSKKDVKLMYNCEPESTWYEYGKKASVSKEFDYAKRIKSAIISATNPDKGGLTHEDVIKAIFEAGITIDDVMNAMPTDIEQAA
tara:strand:- start:13711 stop:14277 length:567 start_codon:yes stop_codon:yes gene_type:complete